MLNFALINAEASPEVFLFHLYYVFKKQWGVFVCSHFDFRYARISIILHIYNFLALNIFERNIRFHPSVASCRGCLISHPPFQSSEGPARAISAISCTTSSCWWILPRLLDHTVKDDIIELGRFNLNRFQKMGECLWEECRLSRRFPGWEWCRHFPERRVSRLLQTCAGRRATRLRHSFAYGEAGRFVSRGCHKEILVDRENALESWPQLPSWQHKA